MLELIPGSGFDVVLCCDLVYRNGDERQRALARTMRRALGLGDAAEEAEEAEGARSEKEKEKASRVAVVAYQFRENVLGDAPFFDEVDRLFADPTRHDAEDEDLWLFEYRPKRERRTTTRDARERRGRGMPI